MTDPVIRYWAHIKGNNILESVGGVPSGYEPGALESVAREWRGERLPLYPSDILLPHLSWDSQVLLSAVEGVVPRIPDFVLDGVGFLYPTVELAENHARQGGTCFLVGRPVIIDEKSPVSWVPYAVSNRHVVWNSGCSVIRLNRRDGSKPDVIHLEPTDWQVHPGGGDVAVASLIGKINQAEHKISFIPTTRFVTRELVDHWEIGVGDEVFMVGRFVNHQGKTDNVAAARFGTISVMPQPIYNKAIQRDQLSFAVEMRSRTGFSWSLVTVYRTVATVLTTVKQQDFFAILGVNWGHVMDEDGENTWLNGVVPAWEILETLDVPALSSVQARATEAWRGFQTDGTDAKAVIEAGLQVASPDVKTNQLSEHVSETAMMMALLVS